MKEVIITGATSMLGIALLKECIKNNTKVIAIVRRNSLNINSIPNSELVRIVECNLDEYENLEKLISDRSFDSFYHFAWDGTTSNERNDVIMQNKNIACTINTVKAALELECKLFIGAGSQAEYGRVENKISPNTHENPENAYGIAKHAAGRFSRILSNQIGIKHIWTRIFSTYGPHDNENSMIIYAIDKFLKREKPSFTKCEQMWDYLYCDDAARAFYLIGEKGKANTIYNIGSGIVRQLGEYIEIIKNYVDENLEIGIGERPYAENQVMHLCADISNLKEDTGFAPSTSFEKGIFETIQWYKGEIHK